MQIAVIRQKIGDISFATNVYSGNAIVFYLLLSSFFCFSLLLILSLSSIQTVSL